MKHIVLFVILSLVACRSNIDTSSADSGSDVALGTEADAANSSNIHTMTNSMPLESIYGGYCCDAAGFRRCVLTSPGVVGAACFCYGQGWGWICQ